MGAQEEYEQAMEDHRIAQEEEEMRAQEEYEQAMEDARITQEEEEMRAQEEYDQAGYGGSQDSAGGGRDGSPRRI